MADTPALDLSKRHFLEPAELDEAGLLDLCGSLAGASVDDAELYFQYARSESWALEDGIVKDGSFDIRKGVGVRVIVGEKSGFAYSDEIALAALADAGKAARSIAHSDGGKSVRVRQRLASTALYAADDPLTAMSATDKVALLQSIDAMARRKDSRVKQVMASINGLYEVVLVANADGLLAADVRPLVRINVSVIAERNGRREMGREGAGGRYDYAGLLKQNDPSGLVDRAVESALINLDSVAAPAGEMVVVLGPGWPGVLLHEAIGHGLEGDFCRKGVSAFAGRIGEKVAAPGVTVVDDGTLAHRRGSLNMDDEGTPTSCTTLIENGVLKGFMQDKLNAHLMGDKPTGNGRRESYAHPTLPRMTNTYMLPGPHSPQEIIKSVDKGVYAANFGGGQVDITSGKFVFSASEAYAIEGGQIGAPLKGMSLIGNGPDVLTRVTMVGNDLRLDAGIGVCGKNGQMLPVGVGQPTLRIDGVTVGGTDA